MKRENRGLKDQPRSMPNTDAYRSNYDAIFKPKVPAAPTAGDTEEVSPALPGTAPARLPRSRD